MMDMKQGERRLGAVLVRFILGLAAVMCAGCVSVAPWEKEKLSLKHMAFEPDPLEARSRQHTFASKEGTSAGYGVGGGGCGCN